MTYRGPVTSGWPQTRVRECEEYTGARTCAQARSHLNRSAGASIYTQRAEQRFGYSRRCSTAREIQAGAPSRTEQEVCGAVCVAAGTRSFKTMLD